MTTGGGCERAAFTEARTTLVLLKETKKGVANLKAEKFNFQEQSAQHINELERELKRSREKIKVSAEQQQTTNEKLEATNEELIASNEELQSTNQELESVNEQLTTLKVEIQQRIDEILVSIMLHPIPQREIGRLRREAQKAMAIVGHRPRARDADNLASALEELHVIGAELEIQNENLRVSRTRAEEAQQRYFEHFDLAPVGMIGVDRHGLILEANILGAKMLGLDRSRLYPVKVALRSRLAGDSLATFSMHMKTALTSRKMESCEVRLRKLRKSCDDGTLVRMQSVASAGAGERMHVLVSMTDLTDHEQAEAARLELERKLLNARRLENIGTLAGGIAHDLNNVLQTILANLELALRANADVPLLPFIEGASQATMRASRLSNRLLTFSEGGKPVKQSVDVAEILGPSVIHALSGSEVKAEFFVQPDIPPIQVDPVQLAHVIENVAINAREATPGPGTLVVRVDAVNLSACLPCEVTPGNYLRIAFEDHGAGIPENVRDKIFDVCFTTKPEGIGIGLTTAKSVIEQHGGHIQVESEFGRGCTVSLLLPAAGNPAAPLPVTAAGVRKGSGRILVVDDQEGIRDVVALLLADIGYECVGAKEGSEGCKAYVRAKTENRPFAAVLLDATIPGGVGGEGALRLLLQADPAARVILSSGYAASDLMANALELGFKGR